MENPFYLKEIPEEGPFCNRIQEISQLVNFAKSKNNVVIHAQRRYGKTSLARRVQAHLKKEGATTIFVDFFGVGSIEDVAARVAEAVFRVTHKNEPLWTKAMRLITTFRPVLRPSAENGIELSVESTGGRSGIPLLKDTLVSLGEFISNNEQLVHVVLDEFQEIVVLPNPLEIEATLRTEMQRHRASYFFIGSRRRLLLAMFNERHRPFFQSAFDFPLKPLPVEELAEFVSSQFDAAGKKCGRAEAKLAALLVESNPYYAQKVSHFIFEKTYGQVTEKDVIEAFQNLISAERGVFEAIFQNVPPQQRLFLRALAKESTNQPFSKGYSRRHNLGSLSAIQNSVKQLSLLDLIEQTSAGEWVVIDPIFRRWLGGPLR